MSSLVNELVALTSKQQKLEAEHATKVADLQERNQRTKDELSQLYKELQVLEDEQDEYIRHIRALHQIGSEYPLLIRNAELSSANGRNIAAAKSVEKTDSSIAEHDRSSRLIAHREVHASTTIVHTRVSSPVQEPTDDFRGFGEKYESSTNGHKAERSYTRVCYDRLHGRACKLGDECPFRHEENKHKNTVCDAYQRGHCAYGDRCFYLHQSRGQGSNRAEDGSGVRDDKSQICYLHRLGECADNSACRFRYDALLPSLAPKFEVSLCRAFQNGYCKWGDVCRYSHNDFGGFSEK